jgi:hypothetical protein
MSETVSLEVAIEVVLRNGPNFETIAGLCKMAVEAEREACAKMCEEISPKVMDVPYGDIRWGWKYKCPYAAAIRARGQA